MQSQDLDRDARLKFLSFSETSRQALRGFWPVLEPHMDAILHDFYVHLRTVPLLNEMLGSEERANRVKKAQKTHWKTLFQGDFGSDYMNRAQAIGEAHSRIGLDPRWYIAGYNLILGRITQVAVGAYRWRPGKLTATLQAIQSALMLDMDLAISVYNSGNAISERDRRRSKIDDLIASFEGQVGAVVAALSAATSDMEDISNSVAADAVESGTRVGSVATSSSQATDNIQTVAAASEELASAIGEIGRQVTQSANVAARAVNEAEKSGATVGDLSKAAQKIGEVVGMISDVAARTRLLALNATIEAVRAGDVGKGFAVVAGEVKDLANQTSRATDEIESQISVMQSATTGTVTAIAAMRDIITEISDISTAIAAAVEEQNAATQEIARSVREAVQETTAVSGKATEMAEAAAGTGASVERMRSAVAALAEQQATLQDVIDGFLSNVRTV